MDSKSSHVIMLMIAARSSGRVSIPQETELTIAYDKLAEELKDKLNIVAVDCDAHRAVCTRNGVKGFPTIKM